MGSGTATSLLNSDLTNSDLTTSQPHSISVVKSAKFMARKLQVETFASQCTKVVASAVCDDVDSVKVCVCGGG